MDSITMSMAVLICARALCRMARTCARHRNRDGHHSTALYTTISMAVLCRYKCGTWTIASWTQRPARACSILLCPYLQTRHASPRDLKPHCHTIYFSTPSAEGHHSNSPSPSSRLNPMRIWMVPPAIRPPLEFLPWASCGD